MGERDEIAEDQLLTYARELNRVFRSERALAAELDDQTRRLHAANLAAVRTLALVVGRVTRRPGPTWSAPSTWPCA